MLSLQKIAGSTLEGGLGNIGLAEPLRVYSNVEGGTGIMDTLQQAPALWYWSEPASGYSIEDCEQIVAEEMQTAKAD